MKFKHINSVVVSGAGVCNLHCPYCYLNHYSMYADYHKRLMQAWEDGSYANNIIKLINTIAYPENIATLRIFGAETSLGAGAIAPNLFKLKQSFPNLDEVFLVTNFSTHIENFMTLIQSCNDNNISHLLFWISLDGIDSVLNEKGHNVPTSVYEKNFDKFFDFLNNTPLPNIKKIELQLKPVVSVQTLLELDTTDKCAQHMDSYFNFLDKLNVKKKQSKVDINLSITTRMPLLAAPVIGTTEEGRALADQFYLYQQMICEENVFKKHIPSHGRNWVYKQWLSTDRFYKFGEQNTDVRYSCGRANIINVLYDGTVVHCDNWLNQSDDLGLEQLKEENYFEYIGEIINKQGMIPNAADMTEEEYYKNYRQLQFNFLGGTGLFTAMDLACAKELALSGQINRIYLNNLDKVHQDFSGQFALHCPNRNTQQTHTVFLNNLGVYRTLLNGRGAAEIEWTTELMKEKYEV